MNISYLSPSQISMYLRCPMQWYYRYGEGIILPPAGAMVKGRAVHRGLDANYKQKIDTFEDLPNSDVVELAVTAFEEEQVQVDWDCETETKDHAKDAVASMTKIYQDEIAPTVQPIASEEWFEIEVAGERVVGIIDVMTANGVRDTKTSEKTPPTDVAEKSLQLACYSLAYQNLMGMEPQELSLDYVVHGKKETKTMIRAARPSPVMTDIFARTVEGVAKAIRAEVFYPVVDGWHCSPKWCGYWDICKEGRK